MLTRVVYLVVSKLIGRFNAEKSSVSSSDVGSASTDIVGSLKAALDGLLFPKFLSSTTCSG
jgi:hypothetical protein